MLILLASLWTSFATPSQASKPWTYWFWPNSLTDRETMSEELADIADLGFGGILLTDSRGYWDDEDHVKSPPPPIRWGGDEWRGLLEHGFREAAKHGLKMIVNVAASGGYLRGDEWLFAAMGFCGIFCYQFLENCAIYYTNASNVAIFVSFGPIVTAALARMFTKDRSLSAAILIGSLIAVGGVALVSLNGVINLHLRPLGDLMAFGAMVSWGVYSILIDKVNEKGYPPGFVIRKAFGWSLVMMLPLCVWGVTDSGYCALDGSFSVTLDWATNVERFSNWLNLLNLAFLGLLASAACFAMWNYACNTLGVVRATIGLYLTPIVGVIFSVFFLEEHLTPMSALGGIVIILGVAIASWRKK